VSFPPASFENGELLKESPGRNPFQAVDEFRQLVLGCGPEHDMDVINLCLQGQHRAARVGYQRGENFFEAVADSVRQNRPSVFDAPHDVIGEEKDRMTALFQLVFHKESLSQPIPRINEKATCIAEIRESNQYAIHPPPEGLVITQIFEKK
jgi:hypothetical protein